MRDYSTSKPSLVWLFLKAIAGGVFGFFLGFFLSLFVTVPWANHHWAGEAQASLGALWPSLWIGVLSAVAGAIILLMKANVKNEKSKRQ